MELLPQKNQKETTENTDDTSLLESLYNNGTILGQNALSSIKDALNSLFDLNQEPEKSTNSENADTTPPLTPPAQFNKAKGMISIPTPGAHVWVMFEGGDPNYPIVLGAIYGQADYQGIHDIPSGGNSAYNPTPGSIPGGYGKEYESGTVTGKPGSGRWLKKYDDADGNMVTAADRLQQQVGNRKAGGRCYNYVKNGILANGSTDNTNWFGNPATDTSAKNAGPALTSRGFTKTNITDPMQAPPGAVIVYSGGDHGHIEMRTSDGGFVSDYYSRNPPGPSRRVSGIYVK